MTRECSSLSRGTRSVHQPLALLWRRAIPIFATIFFLAVLGTSVASADESLRIQVRASSALCRSGDVNMRITAVENEIKDLEIQAREISGKNVEGQNYNDPHGQIPKLASELRETHEKIAKLRLELRRLISLPPCVMGGALPPLDDECFSSDVQERISWLKKLLHEAEGQLALDKHVQNLADNDVAKGSDFPDPVSAQSRLAAANAAVTYDRFVIERLKSQIAQLEALPPCSKDHPAHSQDGPSDEDGQGSQGEQDEGGSDATPPNTPSTPPPKPDAESGDRPEIGAGPPSKKDPGLLGGILGHITVGVGIGAHGVHHHPEGKPPSDDAPSPPAAPPASPPD
jgi:hypothetical protein